MRINYKVGLMSEPKVVIIIPSYNGVDVVYKGKPVLKHCLDSMKKTSYKNYKILISDDCSTDNSVEYVRKNWPYVNVIRRKKNGGYEANANTGIKYALKHMRFDYVVMLNNDIIIRDGRWLSKLVSLAESDENIGLVGCNIIYPNGKTQGNVIRLKDKFSLQVIGKSEKDYQQYSKIKDAHVISGVVQVIKRKTIKIVGLMDENFINGYDDEDYCFRIKKAGLRLVYDGKVKVVHLQSMTLKNTVSRVSTVSKRTYNNSRNSFYFLRKHRSECGYVRLPVWYCIYFLSQLIYVGMENGESNFSDIRLRENLGFNLKSVIKAFVDSFRLKFPEEGIA